MAVLRQASVALAVVAAVLALSGCGDSSSKASPSTPKATAADGPVLTHDGYQKAIWDIRGGDDDTKATGLFFDLVAHDLPRDECGKKTHELHDHLAAIMDDVQALNPPAEAAKAQQEFLVAANESVRLVGVAADDVDKGDLTCGDAMNDRIYGMPSTERAEQAIQELVELGYNVLGN